MKTIISAVAATTALVLALPAGAQDRSERSEQAFAELVEGRVAGEPKACIAALNPNRLEVVEYVGITYEQGDTLWVARDRNAHNLSSWDVPIIKRYSTQLCRQDVTQTVDRSTGMFSGALFLDDFVPYTLVDEDAEA